MKKYSCLIVLIILFVLFTSSMWDQAEAVKPEPTLPDISGTWLFNFNPQGSAKAYNECIYINQYDSFIFFYSWIHEWGVSFSADITGGDIALQGEGTYYGDTINSTASATIRKNNIGGDYAFIGAYNESGKLRAMRATCKHARGWVRQVHIQDVGYYLDFALFDLITEGIVFTSGTVEGPYIGSLDLYSYGSTEYDYLQYFGKFLSDTKPNTGDMYTFHVNYSDGTSETVTAPVRAAYIDFPSTLSPEDGEVISTLTPTLTWGSPPCGCQGYYRIWIVDEDGNTVWSVYPPKETVSVVYNFDGEGVLLQSGKTYEWRLIAFDGPTSFGFDNNVWVISTFTVE